MRIEYEKNLDIVGEEKLKVIFVKECGLITEFKIIYFSFINGVFHEITKWDCHGGLHQHMNFLEGKSFKKFMDLEINGENLNFLINEVKENFLKWKLLYIKNKLKQNW